MYKRTVQKEWETEYYKKDKSILHLMSYTLTCIFIWIILVPDDDNNNNNKNNNFNLGNFSNNLHCLTVVKSEYIRVCALPTDDTLLVFRYYYASVMMVAIGSRDV